MKKFSLRVSVGVLLLLILAVLCTGCPGPEKKIARDIKNIPKDNVKNAPNAAKEMLPKPAPNTGKREPYSALRARMIAKYSKMVPKEWGEKVTGARTSFTNQNAIALTFDACGPTNINKGYDAQLIDYLVAQKIPATLFITSLWIDANPDKFKMLSQNGLFEIENHGSLHRPLSVNGRTVYDIKGTKNVGEVVDEVEKNGRRIEALNGRKPRFYRSGTDYYDDVAVRITNDLGYQVVSYNVLGDAGGTFKKEQVKNALLSAKPGSIVILHMNRPQGETAEGVMEAIPILKSRGIKFVHLQNYTLK